MKYETAAAQVAAEASAAPQQSEKACGGSSQEPAQPALQRCENCGGTGHNAQTCKKKCRHLPNQMQAGVTHIASLFDSNEIEDV
jgi:hypothetical protein